MEPQDYETMTPDELATLLCELTTAPEDDFLEEVVA